MQSSCPHSAPTTLLKAETKKKNIDDPEADLFSILNDLESMRNAEGVFHFKLCYPELAEDFPCNEWVQSSNPLTQQKITGFAGIRVSECVYVPRSVGFGYCAWNMEH